MRPYFRYSYHWVQMFWLLYQPSRYPVLPPLQRPAAHPRITRDALRPALSPTCVGSLSQ